METAKEYWESTADKFAHRGYKAVCTPSSRGLFNWYNDFLQRTALKSIANPCKGATVLDVGCGVGRWSSRLSKSGAWVIGIDMSRNMVTEARRRLRASKHDAELLVSTAANLPFGDSVFDQVLSVTVLQHIVDEGEVRSSIAELTRVTKTGGKVVLLEWSPAKSTDAQVDSPMAFRSIHQWMDLLANTGLRVEQVRGVDPSPFRRILFWMRGRLVGRSYRAYVEGSRRGELSARLGVARAAWYILVSIAVLLSLPFDLVLRNRYPESSIHRLFVMSKL